MDVETRREHVRTLMDGFAERTGLTGDAPPRRYLWTDAFAVCTYASLHRWRPDGGYLDVALRLVEQVHHVLGRYRDDDARRGWLSGLGDDEGELRPTAGGLRIGKPLPERTEEEPLSSSLEWDRDGQYFHYLTKWMLALHRVARVTHEPTVERWAIELAKVAYERFSYTLGSGPKRMVWKMSTDLSRPLVASMGQHDPLDGLVVVATLSTSDLVTERERAALDDELDELLAMCRDQRFMTSDPLGIGALLGDTSRLLRLLDKPVAAEVAGGSAPLARLASQVLDEAVWSLSTYPAKPALLEPAGLRLAFRELGLSLGLAAAERIVERGDDRLAPYLPLRDEIESFWLEPAHQAVATWSEHCDINAVMLAASLAA